MNKLQSIDAQKFGQIFVTMNPLEEPAANCVIEEYSYTHPLYNSDVCREVLSFCLNKLISICFCRQLIASQSKLKLLNKDALKGTKTLFCGAWANYGFHEDGLTAGLICGELLGAKCPFPIVDSTHIRALNDTIPFQNHP